MVDNRFRDQVVVVTGASSGIGRAVARALGARGARVGLIARGQEALEHAAEEIGRSGGEALVLPLDVADADAVEAAAARVEERWGRIDTWINDAMVTVFAPVMQMTAAEYKRVTEVTYLGYVYGTLAALKRMAPRNRGTIVQVGSALAYRAIPLQSAYCGGKFAIRGFTDSLRTELLHDGSQIRVTMVQLPAVNTPQFRIQKNKLPKQAQPVPPIFDPDLIAEAILWAAEHAPREMLVCESAMKAVLGNKLAPGYADQVLASMGYSSQMTAEPHDPDAPNNLYEPLPGDHGAHGPFKDQQYSRDTALWLRMHPNVTLGAAGAAALTAAGLITAVWRKLR